MTSPNTTEPRISTPDPDPEEYLDDPRFHQTFTLPAGPSRPHPFTVTYCDYGYRNPENPESERVLLLCGPLLGSRYLHIAKDKLAKQHGVRIIDADRPGFGGTTAVPSPADRVRAWLELVPALLEHLGVRRVALAAHSGGTVYALNTLLHLRHLLSATRPYVALCAPWVRPSRSGAPLMTLAGGLPEALVGHFDKVAGFFARDLAPVTGFSDAASAAVSGLLPSFLRAKPPPMAPGVDARMACFEQRLYPRLFERVYTESVQGLGQDAVLLLKHGGAGDWGAWEDYDGYVALLAEQEGSLGPGVAELGARLSVDVFFSESDNMIGTGDGPRWFDHCWRAEKRGDRIDYASCVVPGTEHDTIVSLWFGVFERIFRRMAGADEHAAEAAEAAPAAGQTVPLRQVTVA